MTFSPSYWMRVPPVVGETKEFPKDCGIAVVGSGLSGASVAYWLQKQGFEDISIIDYKSEEAATYRNCGHILYGTVESMKAMVELHGREKARELWAHSIDICHRVRDTIGELGDVFVDRAEYRQDGYLVIANTEVEDQECRESVRLLNEMGFQSDYVDAHTVRDLGFKNCQGARYEAGSAQAHPVKFRNGLMQHVVSRGARYYSDVEVIDLEEDAQGVAIRTSRGVFRSDAVVVAANAYSPLFSGFFRSRGLIDPFRGQIIASRPLKHEFRVKYPHSFDHGYEYAIVSADNRLVLGGWRNHSPTGERGTYSLEVNPMIEEGLRDFALRHYDVQEPIEWEYSWSGIMAASRTGLPYIGNTSSPRIYACCAYTGHGFSWAHGSAEILARIIAGADVPTVAKYFNPKTAL